MNVLQKLEKASLFWIFRCNILLKVISFILIFIQIFRSISRWQASTSPSFSSNRFKIHGSSTDRPSQNRST